MNPLLAKSLMGAGIGAAGGLLTGGEGHHMEGALEGALLGGAGSAIHHQLKTNPAYRPPPGASEGVQGAVQRPAPGHGISNMYPAARREVEMRLAPGVAGLPKIGAAYQSGRDAALNRFVR